MKDEIEIAAEGYFSSRLDGDPWSDSTGVLRRFTPEGYVEELRRRGYEVSRHSPPRRETWGGPGIPGPGAVHVLATCMRNVEASA